MTTFTEAAHAAEFILSESNGHRSREEREIATGITLVAGQVFQLTAGKATTFTGTVDSNGALVTQAAGIAIYPGTAGEKIATLERDAEVNINCLTYPAETTSGDEEANTIASLKLLGIITR